MKRVWLLSALLCSGCNGVRLDLLEPRDASVAALDAGIDASRGLILRYDFAGVGLQVLDRVGTAHAVARGGAALDDSGVLSLDGIDDYVVVPSHSLSALSSTTLVTWVSWQGGTCWQHLMDFGSNDDGGTQAVPLDSLYIALSTCPEGALEARQERTGDPYSASIALSSSMLVTERALNLAVAFDAASSNILLYLDGSEVARAPTLFPLPQLRDLDNWLGRSQWARDPYAHVRFDEFRVYDRALTADELQILFTRGPNAL